MTSPKLQKARDYELAHEDEILPSERPAFHYSTRVGWHNDPNGFSWYQGMYHLFCQYHPYSSVWGPMHWGHAVSRDLLHWDYLPAAMAPDTDADSFGVFSGSASELPDGRQLLLYTGVRKETAPDGHETEVQTQCVAVGDGTNYEKYAGNPVISGKDLPEGFTTRDFRDPKIWKKSDGTYTCIVSCRDDSGSAQLLQYVSRDGFHWNYKQVFFANHWRFGNMWECPDFAACDGSYLLMVSPMDMLAKGWEYPNGRTTMCFIGDYDEGTDVFCEKRNQIVDSGIDFYAPQMVKSPDGRTIMIGWMANLDVIEHRHPVEKWYGMMTLPRELSVRNGMLYQQPIRELEQLRRNPVVHRNVTVDGTVRLPGIQGRCAELLVSVWLEDASVFCIRFAENEQFHMALTICREEGLLKLDRRFSGIRQGGIHQRECLIGAREKLELRLILDRYSAEVFVGEGERVMTAAFFTEPRADGISFTSNGSCRMDVEKYDLG